MLDNILREGLGLRGDSDDGCGVEKLYGFLESRRLSDVVSVGELVVSELAGSGFRHEALAVDEVNVLVALLVAAASLRPDGVRDQVGDSNCGGVGLVVER